MKTKTKTYNKESYMNIITKTISNEHEASLLINNLNIIVENLNLDLAQIIRRQTLQGRQINMRGKAKAAIEMIANSLSVCESLDQENIRLNQEIACSSKLAKRTLRKIVKANEEEKSTQLAKYFEAKENLSHALSKISEIAGELETLETEESTDAIIARYKFNVHNLYNPHIKKLNEMAGTNYPTIDEKKFRPTPLLFFGYCPEENEFE